MNTVPSITESLQNPIQTVSQKKFKRRTYVFFVFLLSISIGIVLLTTLAKHYSYFPVDLTVTQLIQNIHHPFFDFYMKGITVVGNAVPGNILMGLACLLLFIKNKKRESVIILSSTLGIQIISYILKLYVGRIRPDPNVIRQVGEFALNDSFPSGHVLFYVGFFGMLFYLSYSLLPKSTIRTLLLWVFSILILSVSISRMYLGAHWFSDILGAYLTGIIWMSIMIYVYERNKATT